MKHRQTRKNDLLLILALLLLAAGVWLVLRLTRQAGGSVRVSVDGAAVAVFPLDADRVWTWEETGVNVLRIENGKAAIVSADCPDKLCVGQGEICYAGESIVCLPHRLTVTVEGAAEGGFDAVAR